MFQQWNRKILLWSCRAKVKPPSPIQGALLLRWKGKHWKRDFGKHHLKPNHVVQFYRKRKGSMINTAETLWKQCVSAMPRQRSPCRRQETVYTKGLQTSSHGPNLALYLVLHIKFYWTKAHPFMYILCMAASTLKQQSQVGDPITH